MQRAGNPTGGLETRGRRVGAHPCSDVHCPLRFGKVPTLRRALPVGHGIAVATSNRGVFAVKLEKTRFWTL